MVNLPKLDAPLLNERIGQLQQQLQGDLIEPVYGDFGFDINGKMGLLTNLLEDVHNLASDENVEKWQSAIANYLINVKDEISLVKLQRVLQMPMVEVWLGLLLGNFTLEQRGDFYSSQDIWVITNADKLVTK
ncbi:hypothetical protein [Nostoc sp. 'Peltigera membranacea cyanobiont' 232]|uniref:hypothetical protein n=1 Tax=Nostoc sp. 'Peltigera membranacea cyanobiont' 232 TaxID=2014531 RepID=UPI001CB98E77|nr:hypothetical protein [Nostoc sp. 'Peltigera membranacea cyanobiont' 232]